MNGPSLPISSSQPRPTLTTAQRDALRRARHSGRKIGRAATVACVSSWTIGIFGAITLIGGIVSPAAAVLGAGMLVCAGVERRNARELRAFNANACRRLGFNQLAFGVMLMLYSAWMLYRTLTGPGPYEAELAAGGPVAEALAPIAELHTFVGIVLYSSLGLGGGLGAGIASLYYFTRERLVQRHLSQTPEWIIETLRAAA